MSCVFIVPSLLPLLLPLLLLLLYSFFFVPPLSIFFCWRGQRLRRGRRSLGLCVWACRLGPALMALEVLVRPLFPRPHSSPYSKGWPVDRRRVVIFREPLIIFSAPINNSSPPPPSAYPHTHTHTHTHTQPVPKGNNERGKKSKITSIGSLIISHCAVARSFAFASSLFFLRVFSLFLRHGSVNVLEILNEFIAFFLLIRLRWTSLLFWDLNSVFVLF